MVLQSIIYVCIATVTNEIKHVAYMVHGREEARAAIQRRIGSANRHQAFLAKY